MAEGLTRPVLETLASLAPLSEDCDEIADGDRVACGSLAGYPGCKLWVSIESLPDRPVLMGIIMSCTHVSGMLHRIGIKFVAREKD